MLRKRRLKQKVKRLSSNKFRRMLHIHKLKRRIKERQRVGFMMWRAE
ncbi:hypothetical protein [Glaesserella sp.]